MLPIRCLACQHRFQRTAAAVLADDRCPHCASTDIDVDEAGLAAKQADNGFSGKLEPCPRCGGGVLPSRMESHMQSQYCRNSYGTPYFTVDREIQEGKRDRDGRIIHRSSVSRTGTPSPTINVAWTENDSWRPGDPPRDPNYSDRYFTFRIAHTPGSGTPEPINVIEAFIHDHSSFGVEEYQWEVDGTSQWGDDFAAHGRTTDLEQAKAQAAAAIQNASDQFWAKYDDSETPKGTPGGFPWDRRAALASEDLSFEPDPVEASFINAWIDGVCVARIDTRNFDVRWIDGMDGRGANTLSAAKKAIQERLDRPSYRRLLTEAPVGVAWPRQASKIGAMALSIKDSNPEVPFSAAVELAREAARRFPSVVA